MTPRELRITVRPLTPDRWPDLVAVFEAKGCSIARGCWCMYYRERDAASVPPGRAPRDVRRARLERLARSGPPPGLLGYHGRVPVGWVAVAPRTQYVRLQRSRMMKAVDEQPVWSILCFVVPSEFRHRGVARALLQGAIAYARRQGATLLEAYPVDRAGCAQDDSLWARTVLHVRPRRFRGGGATGSAPADGAPATWLTSTTIARRGPPAEAHHGARWNRAPSGEECGVQARPLADRQEQCRNAGENEQKPGRNPQQSEIVIHL